ncbi:hypothetical protein CSE16_03295 [Solibacillus sp. R5-41]|uniref:UPF0738 family protein n=1 Tax=Solibacillus sp. R5-41 TaxID=2048654 RepID=UPI000C12817B|nr:hypothetical protein [Solibacillus sp. R5-41]ATP39129.1 hypothetical protein CSE16_03295 [Solibacillus sp. R5-41]
MRKLYIIEKFEIVDQELHFILNEKEQHIQLQATGQVIVDSDNETFLYIVEEDNAYSYISFSKEIWPQLLQMILTEQTPLLRLHEGPIALTNFVEELTMLLFNIEGNGNYGEAFVAAVEQEFSRFFELNEV